MRYVTDPFPQISQFHLPDIHAVHPDTSFGHIKETRNQIHQSTFTTSGTSDKGNGFSFPCFKGNIGQHFFFRSRISKAYMIKDYRSFLLFFRFYTVCRIFNRKWCIQDFQDTIGSHTCTWQHNRHHRDHQERHDNLHRILDKCHHITHPHITGIDTVCTGINNQYTDPVHDQHHQRHHKSHRTIDKQVGLRQSLICFFEPFFFMFFPAERTNHRNTGQDLTADQVQTVDQILQLFKLRHSNSEEDCHQNQNRCYCDAQDPCHRCICVQHFQNTANTKDRRI